MEDVANKRAKILRAISTDYRKWLDSRLKKDSENSLKYLVSLNINKRLLYELENEENTRSYLGIIIFLLGLFIWILQLSGGVNYGWETNATMIIAATFLICFAAVVISFPKKISEILKQFPGIPFKDHTPKK